MRLYRLVCLTDDATGVINGFDKYTSFDDACNAGAAWADYWSGHILMVVETNINENPELVEGTKAKFRRTPVNGTPHGTIAWYEHEQAWRSYNRHHSGQSVEEIARRGGFGLVELTQQLGRVPHTWLPDDRTNRRYFPKED